MINWTSEQYEQVSKSKSSILLIKVPHHINHFDSATKTKLKDSRKVFFGKLGTCSTHGNQNHKQNTEHTLLPICTVILISVLTLEEFMI